MNRLFCCANKRKHDLTKKELLRALRLLQNLIICYVILIISPSLILLHAYEWENFTFESKSFSLFSNAVAVFTQFILNSWKQGKKSFSFFFPSCCYFEAHEKRNFLFILNWKLFGFVEYHFCDTKELFFDKSAMCEREFSLNFNEETITSALCVYLTEINWFIDNFARENGKSEKCVFKQAAMEKKSSIFDLLLIIILTECWKLRN